jgi:hypothetical protein
LYIKVINYNGAKSVYKPLTMEINLPPVEYEIDLPKVIPLLGPWLPIGPGAPTGPGAPVGPKPPPAPGAP